MNGFLIAAAASAAERYPAVVLDAPVVNALLEASGRRSDWFVLRGGRVGFTAEYVKVLVEDACARHRDLLGSQT